ncbi:MAG: diguanylate cyclase, partial [Halopseudomonas sp.]
FHFKTERVTITVSVGYTAFRSADTLDQVFGRADQAMYQAKQRGRNQIVLAD